MQTKQGNKKQMLELRARKEALRKEVNQIQNNIDASLGQIRTKVTGRGRFNYLAKIHPIRLFCGALAAGFVISRLTGGKKSSKSKHRGVFAAIVIDELKKVAAQKLVRIVAEKIEEAAKNRRNDTE